MPHPSPPYPLHVKLSVQDKVLTNYTEAKCRAGLFVSRLHQVSALILTDEKSMAGQTSIGLAPSWACDGPACTPWKDLTESLWHDPSCMMCAYDLDDGRAFLLGLG